MKNENKIKLYIVDSDPNYLKLLEIQFLKYDCFEVKTFDTGEVCLDSLSNKPDIIILNFSLNGVNIKGINGLETLEKIKTINSEIPVIMLSSQDKMEEAIKCLDYKASDYVVKGETDFMRLHKIISSISEKKQLEKKLNWYMDRM